MIRSLGLALFAALATATTVAHADGPTNLGMVGIQSAWGAYLQAHTYGEMHASNMNRNEEETWFLIQVDAPKHIYALMNWRTGHFLSELKNSCASAEATVIGPPAEWYIESGKPYGAVNAVLFRSVADGTMVGTNKPQEDDHICRWEVTSRDNWGPNGHLKIPMNDSRWGGWWVLSAAEKPTPGKNVWNTVGNAVAGAVNKITPADVATLLVMVTQ